MNNSVFGKTMENLRKWVDIKLVRTDGTENEKIKRIIAQPNFNRRVKFSDELSAIHVKKKQKTKLTLNKPIYVGFSVLDLQNTWCMTGITISWKKKYGENCTLLYTDTDSFLVEIKTKDVYKDMTERKKNMTSLIIPKTIHFTMKQTRK